MVIKTFFLYLSYIVYFVIVLFLTYCFQWVTVLFMGGIRFTAAESYPGDLSTISLVVWSFLFSIIHFIIITMYLFLHNLMMFLFKIRFQNKLAFLLNSFVTVGLVFYYLKVFLD